MRSPSPRRAWIEIDEEKQGLLDGFVALPTEGVDRNLLVFMAT